MQRGYGDGLTVMLGVTEEVRDSVGLLVGVSDTVREMEEVKELEKEEEGAETASVKHSKLPTGHCEKPKA